MSGEKTEKPTPKRLKQARREGRIARSPEVGAWAGVLAASLLLPVLLRHLLASAGELVAGLPEVIAHPEPATALVLLRRGALAGVLVVAPLTGCLLLVGVAAAVAQGGFHPATKLLKPKLSRLNPAAGLKRMLGTHALWEAAKATLKTAVLGVVLYSSVRRLVPTLLTGTELPVDQVIGLVSSSAVTLFRAAAVTGLALSAVDYAVLRRKTGKQLRMSKQEVKDEYRQSEGDPQLKGAIRARQLAMARNRMMADLAKADVVVVNPTHVAVALQYDPARGAPRVVAKGAGAIASRIRAVATEHRIPMVADVPLARALYGACELGQEIPSDLYAAVARVLAFVLSLKARGSAAGLHRPALQTV